jgi:hypothetical protein
MGCLGIRILFRPFKHDDELEIINRFVQCRQIATVQSDRIDSQKIVLRHFEWLV